MNTSTDHATIAGRSAKGHPVLGGRIGRVDKRSAAARHAKRVAAQLLSQLGCEADAAKSSRARPGRAWRTLLIASMGERLSSSERKVFAALTGGREREPVARIEEAWIIAGRRSGKTRSAALLAAYTAAMCEHKLALGERGLALFLAPNVRQAAVVGEARGDRAGSDDSSGFSTVRKIILCFEASGIELAVDARGGLVIRLRPQTT